MKDTPMFENKYRTCPGPYPDLTDPKDVKVVVNRIQKRLKPFYEKQRQQIVVTVENADKKVVFGVGESSQNVPMKNRRLPDGWNGKIVRSS